MTLRLYDTLSRELADFVPVRDGEASIYLCGATVQSAPHLGHVRSGVSFDIARRWLEHSGYRTTFVRNVTDIDDKIIARSAEAGVPWWAWASINETAFRDAYLALGCQAPTLEPRATGHITEMITLMQRLIASDHAYAVDGDVYFDVMSFPPYGQLSRQRLDNMQAAGDSVGDSRKRDPRDFALWKAAKPGEPSWPTPWGDGRPGWHLECSAMATKYLGPSFDIHGGGLDLEFPHHENELAQSQAAGDPFARYWMHNGWVTMSGEKMSKSLGNGLLVSQMLRQWRPVELRYYLGAAHYRSHIEYSEAALAEAGRAYQRIESFVDRAWDAVGPQGGWTRFTHLPDAFCRAMDDDFGVPAALAVVHDEVREGNTALQNGDRERAETAMWAVVDMTTVLGLNPKDPQWRDASTDSLRPVVDSLVGLALDQRQAARERKDYAASDAVRDQLAAAGVAVEDTPDGPRWTIKGTE